MSYRSHFSTRETPQNKPIPGKKMVKNSAGGFAFQVNDWQRLERFLILGSEGGSYYAGARKLTVVNAEAVMRCIVEDGKRVVDLIVEISDAGRAVKNDPALFALAMCAGLGDDQTRKHALESLPKVARIGTHLFHFAEYVEGFRGWGRGLRKAVASWYNNMHINRLSYQAIKYQQRDGWSHADLIKLSHPKTEYEDRNTLYRWILGKDEYNTEALPRIVQAFERAKQADSLSEVVNLIVDERLPREAIPTKWLKERDVWSALLPGMPLMALTRNLGKMTNIGLLQSMSPELNTVLSKLGDKEYISRSRLHPLSILVALKTYAQGKGMRGSLQWSPVGRVIDALDEAFYLSFSNIVPSNKRIMLALDVSGSMTSQISNMPLSCRSASAALAMVTARTEPNYIITAFSDTKARPLVTNNQRGWNKRCISELSITPRQRLDDIIKYTGALPFSGTDCALPMLYAIERQLEIDAFVIYTDSETWAGNIHPAQALQKYRHRFGIDAKLIVVGMVSNGFSIADPNDPGMLDVVGFDTSIPQVISGFIGSEESRND